MGEVVGQSVQYTRKLTESDLVRMRIPKRHWHARPDHVSDDTVQGASMSVREAMRRYVDKIDEVVKLGQGLLLWGANGTGKSSIAVILGKEFRRRGYPVLYMEAADMKRVVVDREMFDDEQLFWDRALNVSVLILDDLGKGCVDGTGFGMRLLDELIRHRNAHKLVTIITTNWRTKELASEVMASTAASLKEHVHPVEVVGVDQRDDSGGRSADLIFG